MAAEYATRCVIFDCEEPVRNKESVLCAAHQPKCMHVVDRRPFTTCGGLRAPGHDACENHLPGCERDDCDRAPLGYGLKYCALHTEVHECDELDVLLEPLNPPSCRCGDCVPISHGLRYCPIHTGSHEPGDPDRPPDTPPNPSSAPERTVSDGPRPAWAVLDEL